MSNFYSDDHRTLSELLTAAGTSTGATLLIPDLQRPYVWTPDQVIRLIDSLLRGWPFGSLLLWAVKQDGIARIPFRPFAMVVDKVDELSEKVPPRKIPANYEMVLDGQQRVQSLLLAFGGDSWGFKKLDREWHEDIGERRPRGPRGKRHWSIGELCLDLERFETELGLKGKLREVDFTARVLAWVVRDSAQQRSTIARPKTYDDPLPAADRAENAGRFIRLSRLWERAADSALTDGDDFEAAVRIMLQDHGVNGNRGIAVQRPLEDLLRKLKELRSLRVTFLRVSAYDQSMGSTDGYMNAVVSVFTRLNSAGRTLTQEEITFAWVKSFWVDANTEGRGAARCFKDLQDQLRDVGLAVKLDDLMSGVAFIWAVRHNAGKVLAPGDLLVESKVKPMAKELSEAWTLVSSSMVSVTRVLLQERGLQYGRHFLSLNALAVLWAWRLVADDWAAQQHFREMERDSWNKTVDETLKRLGETWLIGSQWAGRWGSASAPYVAECASALADLRKAMDSTSSSTVVESVITACLESLARGVEIDAHDYIDRLHVDDREKVRAYYTPLWIWHRLDESRWEQSAVPLRLGRKAPELDVDHAVAVKLWEDIWKDVSVEKPKQGDEAKDDERDQDLSAVNQIGNCMLLNTAFNISKGKRSLASWLEEVHEFRKGELTEAAWAKALGLDPLLLRPEAAPSPRDVATNIRMRTASIRRELKEFVSGKRQRFG